MSDEGERNEQKLPRNSSTPYQMFGNTRSPNYSNYSNFFPRVSIIPFGMTLPCLPFFPLLNNPCNPRRSSFARSFRRSWESAVRTLRTFSKEISIITIIQPRKFLGNFLKFLSLSLSIIPFGMILPWNPRHPWLKVFRYFALSVV